MRSRRTLSIATRIAALMTLGACLLTGAAAGPAAAGTAAGDATRPAAAVGPATGPAATAGPAATMGPDAGGPAQHAVSIVDGMSTAERAAVVVMGHIPTTDPAVLSAYMRDGGLGGFILMGANIPASEAELRALTEALTLDPALPPLIAIDQEGGVVSRLPWDTFASGTRLAGQPVDATRAAFAARGSLVARAGVNVNFGIVADWTADAGSFISGRVLGADPRAAADRVAAAVAGEEQFTASTLKHFPGHGAAPGDSHRIVPSAPLTIEQWRAADAVPFAAGIDAGASLLMFGHLSYPAVDVAPASLSTRWHEIARKELGFDGVIVTDDLGMLQSTGIPAYADPVANAVTAIAAGNDLVLAVAHSTPQTAAQMAAGIAAAVDAGTIPAERLHEAAERVIALRLRIAAASADWSPCSDCAPAG